MPLSVYLCVYLCVCVCECVSVCVYLNIEVCMYVCVCVCACVRMQVCVCVHPCVCVHVRDLQKLSRSRSHSSSLLHARGCVSFHDEKKNISRCQECVHTSFSLSLLTGNCRQRRELLLFFIEILI